MRASGEECRCEGQHCGMAVPEIPSGRACVAGGTGLRCLWQAVWRRLGAVAGGLQGWGWGTAQYLNSVRSGPLRTQGKWGTWFHVPVVEDDRRPEECEGQNSHRAPTLLAQQSCAALVCVESWPVGWTGFPELCWRQRGGWVGCWSLCSPDRR